MADASTSVRPVIRVRPAASAMWRPSGGEDVDGLAGRRGAVTRELDPSCGKALRAPGRSTSSLGDRRAQPVVSSNSRWLSSSASKRSPTPSRWSSETAPPRSRRRRPGSWKRTSVTPPAEPRAWWAAPCSRWRTRRPGRCRSRSRRARRRRSRSRSRHSPTRGTSRSSGSRRMPPGCPSGAAPARGRGPNFTGARVPRRVGLAAAERGAGGQPDGEAERADAQHRERRRPAVAIPASGAASGSGAGDGSGVGSGSSSTAAPSTSRARARRAARP